MASETVAKSLNNSRVPDLDATEQEILGFRDRHFNYKATYRCLHMERMALAIYYHLGRQWIERDEELLVDGVRGYVFKDAEADGEAEFPKPVTNYIAPSVEVELASLGKRELTPNILTSSRDPRLEAAAKAGKAILEHRLKKLDWASQRELVTYLTVVTGTGCLKSYWDETYTELTTIASPEAQQCIGCGYVLSSPTTETSLLPQPPLDQPVVPENPDEPETVELSSCPHCGGQLQPYAPTEEEASEGTDFLGRRLGMEVPKGNTQIEVVSPFDLFPENAGVGVSPSRMKMWAQATVRDLDWIAERYPDRISEIAPEDPRELMSIHPILGEWHFIGRYNAGLDSGIYENHCRVYEIHCEKTYRFPQGRSIVIAGDVILENGPLYRSVTVEGQGVLEVPRVKYSAARFKERHGEFWGQSLVDDLISPQNRVNGLDAQVIEARERMGSPNLLVSEAMELTGPEWNKVYGAGKIMKYNTDPLNPTGKPEQFGSILMPAGVYDERDRIVQDMKQVAGPQDVEIGEAPRNISTTSGLQLLGESAERRRAPRERALIAMYESIWEHQLQLLWTLRSETDEYEEEIEDGSWETKQFDRSAIQGQTKIEIEKQAFVNKSLQQSEGTREALADGLYLLTSAAARKRILELRNLPTDVNEDESRQVEIAKQQWVDFVDEGVIPVVDKSLDNFQIRFEVLGTFLLTDEGKRIEREAMWPQILKLIAGWEDELGMLVMQDAAAFQFYGTRNMPPEQANEAYAQAMVVHQQQAEVVEKANASAQEVQKEGIAAQPIAPPMAPPPPIFIPQSKEDQIYMLWKQMIEQSGQGGLLVSQPVPGAEVMLDPAAMQPEPSAVDSFLRFRAVVDAYRMLAQEQQMQAMAGMPAPGAPGTVPGGPGGAPGGGIVPGQDFKNPANPPTPPIAPGVGGQKVMM